MAATDTRRLSPGARLGSAVLAVWGTITGLTPHVLHHVGPLAGVTFLAGAATGRRATRTRPARPLITRAATAGTR